jgi:hypothetical protein
MSGDHNKYHMKVEFPERFEEERDRKKQADYRIGAWLSAALEDPSVCQSMKDDINEWFECTPKMEARKREWVYLTEEEMLDIVDTYGMQLAEAIEAKLRGRTDENMYIHCVYINSRRGNRLLRRTCLD